MKILINASNLHNGGGVQVASSFISELTKLSDVTELKNYSVVCSSAVYNNLENKLDFSKLNSFDIINIRGYSKPKSHENKFFLGFDKCFTIFGPVYFNIDVSQHICGFAQPWIAYPNNLAYDKLNLIDKLKNRFKFNVQSLFFRRYSKLVVEANHVKEALLDLGFSNSIEVVSNCTSAVFDDPTSWQTLKADTRQTVPKLGFIGRYYPHKNIDILREVDHILKDTYNFDCDFLFTLSEEEMHLCGFSGLNNFKTVGEITSSQCPEFYKSIDALIFPSLLECFSASPIEAMKMRVPILGSRLPFVTDFCGDTAYYFDPLDPHNIASVIYDAFSDKVKMSKMICEFDTIVATLPSAKDRALRYIELLNEC